MSGGLKRARDNEAGGVQYATEEADVDTIPALLTAPVSSMVNATDISALVPGTTTVPYLINFTQSATTDGCIAGPVQGGTVGQILTMTSGTTMAFENAGKSGSYVDGELIMATPSAGTDPGSLTSLLAPGTPAVTQLVMRPDAAYGATTGVQYTNATAAGVWQLPTTTGNVTTGTVPVSFGGTNNTTLTGNTLMISNAGGTQIGSLANGADGTYLTVTGGVPTFAAAAPGAGLLFATATFDGTDLNAFSPAGVNNVPAASIALVPAVPGKVIVPVTFTTVYTAGAVISTTGAGGNLTVFYGNNAVPASITALSDGFASLADNSQIISSDDEWITSLPSSFFGINVQAPATSPVGMPVVVNLAEGGPLTAYTGGDNTNVWTVTTGYYLV